MAILNKNDDYRLLLEVMIRMIIWHLKNGKRN